MTLAAALKTARKVFLELKYPVSPVGDFYRREDGQWMHDFKVKLWHPVLWWIVAGGLIQRHRKEADHD